MFADSYLPQRNGLVTLLCQLTTELVRQGMDVSLFVPGRANTTEESNGVHIHRLRGYSFPFYPGYRLTTMSVRRLRHVLDKEGIDVYHVHDPFSLGAAGLYQARRRQKPIVGTYNTHFVEYIPHFGPGNLRKRFGPLIGDGVSEVAKRGVWRLLRTFYRRCHVVTVPTREIADILRRRGFLRLTVIPNGIALPEPRRIGLATAGVRKMLTSLMKTDSETTVFLYLGRVSLEKRVDVLLRAFSLLDDKAFLVVAGSGPQLLEYRRLASSLGLKNVRFTGTVPDELVRPLYLASDVFASASDTETFGLTFLEAMSCGLPLIGASQGGPVELIEDGENGLLFGANDTGDLSGKMRELLRDPSLRRRMGQRSSQMAKGFSIERVAKDFIDIYNTLSV
ncbi:MAG: glycosyltransferase family 4 protein [Candidatus Geothermarchaeales archaeon]